MNLSRLIKMLSVPVVIISLLIVWFWLNPSLTYEMVLVHGGRFVPESGSAELPVEIDSFYIGKYEVTQEEWEDVMGGNPSSWRKTGGHTLSDFPVESVNWYHAVEFCNRISLKYKLKPYYNIDKTSPDPGNKLPLKPAVKNKSAYDIYQWSVTCNRDADGYRLPTEAEWEYAVHGGNGLQDNCGEDKPVKRDEELLHMIASAGRRKNRIRVVGLEKSNKLCVYDMKSNVLEWCFDWYANDYFQTVTTPDPMGPGEGRSRVVRGGAGEEALYSRTSMNPMTKSSKVGLRLARNAQ